MSKKFLITSALAAVLAVPGFVFAQATGASTETSVVAATPTKHQRAHKPDGQTGAKSAMHQQGSVAHGKRAPAAHKGTSTTSNTGATPAAE
ncbi:hypothetical protein [Tepidiphilus olei]|uniref:hypothetical protein n=1 Tax=Tepidiphilus olei TaxID=2502184 RepID=UPI00115EE82A|nr:hypothetical protein [Tepidiphilus olei]